MYIINHILGRTSPPPTHAPPAPPPQHQQISLSPKETCEALVESAVARHYTSLDVLFLKGLWGGVLLSYGGMLEAVVGGSESIMENNPGLLRLIEGLVFPVGLSLIVLTGTDLLTSDIMIILMGVFKRRIPWWAIIYNWVTIFFGNLVGSLMFAAFLARWADLVSGPVRTFVQNTSATRVSAGWGQVFLKGIGCNIIVCLAVFVANQGSDVLSKIIGIYLVLSCFVAIQYEHVVADMFTIPLGKMVNADFTVGRYIGTTMMGALIGNIVGGLLVAGSLYWMYLRDNERHEGQAHGRHGKGGKDAEMAVRNGGGHRESESEETLAGAPSHGANPNGRGSHF